jgi:hypothetical protein
LEGSTRIKYAAREPNPHFRDTGSRHGRKIARGWIFSSTGNIEV